MSEDSVLFTEGVFVFGKLGNWLLGNWVIGNWGIGYWRNGFMRNGYLSRFNNKFPIQYFIYRRSFCYSEIGYWEFIIGELLLEEIVLGEMNI